MQWWTGAVAILLTCFPACVCAHYIYAGQRISVHWVSQFSTSGQDEPTDRDSLADFLSVGLVASTRTMSVTGYISVDQYTGWFLHNHSVQINQCR